MNANEPVLIGDVRAAEARVADMTHDEVPEDLRAVYEEVQAEAQARRTGQAPRRLFDRIVGAEVACVAESLGPQTQRVSGIPWVLPNGRLSDKGRVLDRDLLAHFGYTADPHNPERKYAYLTDVSHLWLGHKPNGNLRRPSAVDRRQAALRALA